MDADKTSRAARARSAPEPPPAEVRGRVFDESLELEPDVRAALEQNVAAARLAWLATQLEVRDEAISRRVPRWSPESSDVPPEEAIVKAFDEVLSENAREVTAAVLARTQAKQAHGRGVEAGAVGAVLILGLIASAVAIGYALLEQFA